MKRNIYPIYPLKIWFTSKIYQTMPQTWKICNDPRFNVWQNNKLYSYTQKHIYTQYYSHNTFNNLKHLANSESKDLIGFIQPCIKKIQKTSSRVNPKTSSASFDFNRPRIERVQKTSLRVKTLPDSFDLA